jgi:hypothetical protein
LRPARGQNVRDYPTVWGDEDSVDELGGLGDDVDEGAVA